MIVGRFGLRHFVLVIFKVARFGMTPFVGKTVFYLLVFFKKMVFFQYEKEYSI